VIKIVIEKVSLEKLPLGRSEIFYDEGCKTVNPRTYN